MGVNGYTNGPPTRLSRGPSKVHADAIRFSHHNGKSISKFKTLFNQAEENGAFAMLESPNTSEVEFTVTYYSYWTVFVCRRKRLEWSKLLFSQETMRKSSNCWTKDKTWIQTVWMFMRWTFPPECIYSSLIHSSKDSSSPVLCWEWPGDTGSCPWLGKAFRQLLWGKHKVQVF